MSEASERGQRYRDRAKEDVSDLIKRLRAYSGRSIHTEAADRIEELEAQLEAYRKIDKKRFAYMIKLEAQLADKDRLLLTAFQDAKKGVVQMTRKYDGWLTYLAAIKGEES